jgi:hypothetical protein
MTLASSTLALFVARIGANHPNDALPAHDFAFPADLFD